MTLTVDLDPIAGTQVAKPFSLVVGPKNAGVASPSDDVVKRCDLEKKCVTVLKRNVITGLGVASNAFW